MYNDKKEDINAIQLNRKVFYFEKAFRNLLRHYFVAHLTHVLPCPSDTELYKLSKGFVCKKQSTLK